MVNEPRNVPRSWPVSNPSHDAVTSSTNRENDEKSSSSLSTAITVTM
ncbi:unnamed protein product [Arabidopsis halleri]